MSRLPLRWRLTLAFVLVMAVVLAATGLFVYQRQQANLDGAIDGTLRARAGDVAALAQQSESGLKEARSSVSGRGPQVAQLLDASGHVLDSTPGAPARPLSSAAQLADARRGRAVTTTVSSVGDGPVRLRAESVRAQGQKLVVVVGQSLEERDAALSDLGGVLLLGGPAALLLSSVAGYLLTGAALRPVEAMRQRAASISAAELDQRLPAGAGDELGRLGRTLNEMLERIDTSVTRERTFVSDASHELRSPLAMLRMELELIARERPAGHALQTAAGSAIEETDRLSRLADDLLLLARAGDHQLSLRVSGASVDDLLHRAADRMRRAAASAGIEISVAAPPGVRVDVDPDRIGQALDNLVANALRYADTSVSLSARLGAASVELHVTDDGPGFPDAFLARAFERFARADSGRTEDGVGLGLAIVRTIAEAHGGEAHAGRPPGAGADVWITLPLTDRARAEHG